MIHAQSTRDLCGKWRGPIAGVLAHGIATIVTVMTKTMGERNQYGYPYEYVRSWWRGDSTSVIPVRCRCSTIEVPIEHEHIPTVRPVQYLCSNSAYQCSPSGIPEWCQCGAIAVPVEYQRKTNTVPVQNSCSNSSIHIYDQCIVKALPAQSPFSAKEHQWSTDGVPAQSTDAVRPESEMGIRVSV